LLEIEMKFRVDDFTPIIEHLAKWHATRHAPKIEVDHYYNAPDRDFRQTDEAFRLRRINAVNLITYKGPKETGPTKTRTEIEVPLQEGDAVATDYLRVLEKLGYRATAIVRKRRTEYSFQRDGFSLHACLDDVDHVGRYVEIEVVAPPEHRDAAQKVILAVAGELGLSKPESLSYLGLVLQATGVEG
jgi:adenylate cyclase class 2